MRKKMTMKAYERSAMDKASDRKEAKKRGMSIKAWESSKADAAKDRKMVNKINKKNFSKKK